jgi:arylsulfatase A-like enzyme
MLDLAHRGSLGCLALAIALSAAPASAHDLVRLDPDATGPAHALAPERIGVAGAARSWVHADTLEVVLTGRPVELRFPLDGATAARVQGLRLMIAASERVAVVPLWRSAARTIARHALRTLPIATPELVELTVPLPVIEHGVEPIDALVLSLPPVVGRVRIFGPAVWVESPAPRVAVRSALRHLDGRHLTHGHPAAWTLRLPRRARLHLEAIALGHGDSTERVSVEIAARGGTRTHTLEVPRAEDPPRLHAIDLEDTGGAEAQVVVRTEGDASLLGVIATHARIVDLDAPQRPALLLIVVDTLRKHDPGEESGVSRPCLRALAASSIDFANARANSSWTLPSTASLLSGWLPGRHGLGHPYDASTLGPEVPLLPEAMREAGWNTAAISANPLVAPGSGLDRGFASFDTGPARDPLAPSAELVKNRALQWLRTRVGTPWMLYLHLFDPHDPYQAPEPHRSRFVDATRRLDRHPSGVWAGRPDPLREALARGDRSIPVRQRDVDLLAELYRGEVAYTDQQVGALLDSLRAWGELERTIVVLTSDHGEEFLEHGMLKHGHALHEELIAVPLTIALPGIAARTITEAVSLVDLAPSLRTWLQLPSAPTDGQSLASLVAGAVASSPPVPTVAELHSRLGGPWEGLWRTVVDPPWKWVETPRGERLYRLDHDGREQEDLHGRFARVSSRLRAHADSIAQARTTGVVVPHEPDPSVLEALRSLGYIE